MSHVCHMWHFPVCPICAVCPMYAACDITLCVPFVLYVPCMPHVTFPCVSHLCYMSSCAVCPMYAACDISLCVPFMLHVQLCCMSHVCRMWHFPVCSIYATCPVVLYVPCMPHVTFPCVSHLCYMSSCAVCPMYAACDISLCVPFMLHVQLCCMSHVCCMWHYPVCPICATCLVVLCAVCPIHAARPIVLGPLPQRPLHLSADCGCAVVWWKGIYVPLLIIQCCVRCEVLTVVLQRIQVLWDVMLCRWVSGCWHCRAVLFLNCWSAEDEGTLFVQSITNHSSTNSVIPWQILNLIQILLANVLTLLPISGATRQYLLQTLLLLCSWVWFSQQ